MMSSTRPSLPQLLPLALISTCLLSLAAASDSDTPVAEVISYGSSIKLEHIGSGHRLHSHDIPYGSGSQQQSVTAYPDGGDVNSYWIVKAAHLAPRRPSGQTVACGDTIRFQHLSTGRNLHSHLHRAPMTSDYEVSAYKDESKEGGRWFDGDTGDNWVVMCEGKGKDWKRKNMVRFKHVDTGYWLSSSKRNAFGHPTTGQLQVCSTYRKSGDTLWRAAEGLFMHPMPEKTAKENK